MSNGLRAAVAQRCKLCRCMQRFGCFSDDARRDRINEFSAAVTRAHDPLILIAAMHLWKITVRLARQAGARGSRAPSRPSTSARVGRINCRLCRSRRTWDAAFDLCAPISATTRTDELCREAWSHARRVLQRRESVRLLRNFGWSSCLEGYPSQLFARKFR